MSSSLFVPIAQQVPLVATHDVRLIVVAIVAFAVIIVLITLLKVHPFLALMIGGIGVGLGAGLDPAKTVTSFGNGFGSTMGSVGVLIGLGAMYGKLLADSGGADQIVDTLVGRSSARALPWTMALVGAIIGLPMFFEIGLVLLIPVIILVTRRSGLPLMRIAIPTLAGLSAMHGLVPPHPGPLTAIGTLKANLGLTLGLGVLVAIPTVIIAGPLFSRFAARWAPVPVPELFVTEEDLALAEAGVGAGTAGRTAEAGGAADDGRTTDRGQVTAGGRVTDDGRTTTGGSRVVAGRPDDDVTESAAGYTPTHARPSFGLSLVSVLLPVVLMLAKALADVIAPSSKSAAKSLLDFLGNPPIALLLAVIAGIFLLGFAAKMDKEALAKSLDSGLPPIAGILLIVGAGGGFKQVLIDSGIGTVITKAVVGSGISVLFLAWLVAVLVRVATGSATVATVTAAGLMTSVAASLPAGQVALMVLAIGSGSLFLSHVNDAGFWLVKQYLGTDVPQTFKTWTVMECLISVIGLIGVLLLSLIF
jgi:gluconate:H+ symporter, GntP family